MISMVARVLLVALVVGAGGLALTKTADAAHVVAEVSVLDQAEVGRPAQLQVTLLSADDGSAITNTSVVVYKDASFGGVTGEVELGTAVTDENGVATITYEPRSASEHQLRIEYLAPGDSEPEVITKTVTVLAGSSQLHQSSAGIQVPGLNVWLIIALVALVWSILFSVGLRVVAIARAGVAVPIPEHAPRLRDVEQRVAAPKAGSSEA